MVEAASAAPFAIASKPLLMVVTPCCIQVPKVPTTPGLSGVRFSGAGFSAAAGGGAAGAPGVASSAGLGGSAGACAAAAPAITSATATAQIPMLRVPRRRRRPSR
jgi:hypothetical protein